MADIQTYVFLDIETTGLPSKENNKTRITELSLVAVKRHHVLETPSGATPRIQHKLTLLFNPEKEMEPIVFELTGLNKAILENESVFDEETVEMLNIFLKKLKKPICLLAHNGHSFDFPILKNHLLKLGRSLPDDLLYADTLYAFYDIMEGNSDVPTNEGSSNDVNENGKRNTNVDDAMSKKVKREDIASRYRGKYFFKGRKPINSYTLKKFYERTLGRAADNAHRAEGDCMLLLECFVALASDIIPWVDNYENSRSFSEVIAMPVVD